MPRPSLRHLYPTPAERRFGMARRMPQLGNSRIMLLVVAAVCLGFGLAAFFIDSLTLRSYLSNEEALNGLTVQNSEKLQRLHVESRDSQLLYLVTAGFGLVSLVLAIRLYHIPVAAPVATLVLFVATFITFLVLQHSAAIVWYVVVGFLMLAVIIKAVHSGRLFMQSYARMGRTQTPRRKR